MRVLPTCVMTISQPEVGAMNDKTTRRETRGKGATAVPMTVSHLLGEMTWLLTQSPLHRALRIEDIEWLLMPPLIHRQFYIFRDGEKPIGLALWAQCNEAVEGKLDRGMLEPGNRLSLEDWKSGERTWLVDLVAPFATMENKQRQIMIADLISGPLGGREFRLHQTDEKGDRSVQVVPHDAGQRLKEAVDAAIGLAE